jgi:N-acetylglucosamine kinase-like BadF-type ATPase
MSLDLILAADGDADRSETILLTPDGTVLDRADGGPANPSDIGTERAVSNLQTMFDKVLAPYGGLSAVLQSVYVGFAGGWVGDNQKRYYNILRGLLPGARSLDNSSDAINALTSGIGQEDGISLIAGMGSIALVRCCGTINQVGGWGYLIGDEGSSFELGRMGLREALMAIDGRGEMTRLVSMLAWQIGKPIVQAVPDIYSGGKRYIARLAPLVIQAAQDGDASQPACRDQHAPSGPDAPDRQPLPQRNALPGRNHGELVDIDGKMQSIVQDHLDERFILIRPDLPPIYGAALEAMYLLGCEPDTAFKQRFAETYRRFQPHGSKQTGT